MPRVARHELPWDIGEPDYNPNGVASAVAAEFGQRQTQPRGVDVVWPDPQGSSFLATLGWKSQSLWDWGETPRVDLCKMFRPSGCLNAQT